MKEKSEQETNKHYVNLESRKVLTRDLKEFKLSGYIKNHVV